MKSVPISGTFEHGNFITHGFAETTRAPAGTNKQEVEMVAMNRGVITHVPRAKVAKAIWEGKAMMGSDGSVTGSLATYSFVISISQTSVAPDVEGGGFLPPTAKYMDPYSKRPEAAALFAGLIWIKNLLEEYPNHTDNEPTPLPIPVDNQAVIADVHRVFNQQSSTYAHISSDFDILQAIRTTIENLPIRTNIAHVSSHQDDTTPWDELDNRAKINVLADKVAGSIYHKGPGETGLFPTWVPGTAAALFHAGKQVTKRIPEYIREATHTPMMKTYLIKRSHTATGREKSWDNSTYESIDWKHYGESFKKLSHGKRLQISKYTNDLLPTKRRLQTIDNRVDGRCFACESLWETTNHMLTCSCDARHAARTVARIKFQDKLVQLHTPNILTTVICESMDKWIARRPVLPPAWNGPEDEIKAEIRLAFNAQSRIGWDQFFRGRIAKDWQIPIARFYEERQPGDSFTPEQWMRTVIQELWTFSITVWNQRNTELHGLNGFISAERLRKETADAAIQVYQTTIGNVTPSDSIVLHQANIAEILIWTKEHLDAYLASAEAILDQHEAPD